MKTINLQGKEYAQVKDRLAEFRKENPRGLVETTPTIQADGLIMFRARVLKDKAEETSAEATGHALGSNKGVKAFEKLETIAVGRALALLGYGSDGEIASSDEMEEFENYQKQQKEEAKVLAMETLQSCTTLEELKTAFKSIGAFAGDKDVVALKDALKLKLK